MIANHSIAVGNLMELRIREVLPFTSLSQRLCNLEVSTLGSVAEAHVRFQTDRQRYSIDIDQFRISFISSSILYFPRGGGRVTVKGRGEELRFDATRKNTSTEQPLREMDESVE